MNTLVYDLENDGIIMEAINTHFNNDKRVKFEIPGVNCADTFDGFIAVVPCFRDGVLRVQHKVCVGDSVKFFHGMNGYPQIEVIHG